MGAELQGQAQRGQEGCREGEGGGWVLTGQMFSLGVPSNCTIRSTWWISDVPGRRGLWASSSARTQPMALQSRAEQSLTSTRPWAGLELQRSHGVATDGPSRPLVTAVLELPLGIPGAGHLPELGADASPTSPDGAHTTVRLTTCRCWWFAWWCPAAAPGLGTCRQKRPPHARCSWASTGPSESVQPTHRPPVFPGA